MPLTILRPSQLYGISEAFKKNQPLIYNIIEQAKSGMNITLYGTNDAQRNYLYIDDFVDVILNVIEKKILGIYNCQFLQDVAISEVAKSAINAFNSKSKINFLKEEADVRHNVFPIDETLYKKINLYPKVDIKQGMRMIAKNRNLS